MTRTSWFRTDLALIVAIVAFACVAAYLAIRLTRPRPFANAGFSVEWQCHTSLGFITDCARNTHLEKRLRLVAKRDLPV
jgi:hypothetical protein